MLVYQTLCFILSHAYISNGPAAPLDWRYTVRNGYFDSSGYSGSGENPDLDNQTILKKVIGSEGYWFKLTSERQNLEYLWYDTENKNVNIW